MPYSRVTRTAHGADAIKYIRGFGGKGHNGVKERNEYVTGINMLPDNVIPFEQQMQPVWDKADVRHTTQIDRYIISYSKKEVDPDDPEQVAKAHFVGCQIARFLSRGINPNSQKDRLLAEKIGCSVEQLSGKGMHQVMVSTQKDGKGGCVHIHLAVNDVAMDTHRGLNSGLYLHAHLEKIVDYISGIYLDLDLPEPAPEKEPQSVRGLKAKNEKIEKENAEEILKAEKENRKPVLMPLEYIWIDDLKGRILESADEAEDEEDFFQKCRLRGVEVVKKKSTKKQPEHYTYELIDVSGFTDPGKIPKNLKRKSFKLGANYQPENISSKFKEKDRTVTEEAAGGRTEKTVFTVTETGSGAVKQEQEKVIKSPEEIKKEQQEYSMREAEQNAASIALRLYSEDQGWEDNPTQLDETGREWTDYDEIKRRMAVTDSKWDDFKKWRVEQRKAGIKLPGIYKKDNYGSVFVIREEVERQFKIFLHPKVEIQEPMKEEKTKEQKQERKSETKSSVKKETVTRKEQKQRAGKRTYGDDKKKEMSKKAVRKKEDIYRKRQILLREMNEKDKDKEF